MKKLLTVFGISLLLLTACGKGTTEKHTVRVGTIAGPETELMEVAKDVAAKRYQLNIDIVQFSDYVMPNTALEDKSIDANVFQHSPYLQSAIKVHGYAFSPIAKTFIYPMGIYSKKLKTLEAIGDNATIAIPNDPSNGARALLLLDKAGLIKLRKGSGVNATLLDVQYNPKHFVFKELDAAQLPRVLDDVDLAVINTNYALPAGLKPKTDALFIEDKDSPYANIVVVRTDDKDNPKFPLLIKALHSPEVLAKAKQLFGGQAIKAWGNE